MRAMQTSTVFFAFVLCCGMIFGIPVKRDAPPPSNSHTCSSVYHGQCIDTYKYRCHGLLIPGVCNNMTHFDSVDFGAMTQMQCCNAWQIDQIGMGRK